MHVVTLPTKTVLTAPTANDFPNLFSAMSIIEGLRCDMYDNALIPIALANKLVSLADHPSSKILERFAKAHVTVSGLTATWSILIDYLRGPRYAPTS